MLAARVESESQISLGHTFMQSHEVAGLPVVTLNYVNPDPRLPLPSPDGDWYLRNTAVPAIRRGEIVIGNRLIDGLSDYYRRVGVVPSGSVIIEEDPIVEGEPSYAFPRTDPLNTLREGYFAGPVPYYLMSTFHGEAVSEQAKRVGLLTPLRPDSVITNNKVNLRRAAEKYGFNMLPGVIVETVDDLDLAREMLGGAEHGAWLKFPTGSGGDLVRFCVDLSDRSLRGKIDDIRVSVIRAIQLGEFRVSPEEFWPANRLSPEGFPLVIESDARNLGEVVENGSTQIITSRLKNPQLIGSFRQLTTEEGEYLGNRPYYPQNPFVHNLIENQALLVADYNQNENGYFGIQGIDWFLVKDSRGRMSVFVDELNSRPTANTPPVIIADKMDARHWINTNVYTERPVRTIDDYIAIVGEDLANGDTAGGSVIPQAFRTMVSGESVFPSPNFKVLIMGASEQHCDQVMRDLIKRGVRFQP